MRQHTAPPSTFLLSRDSQYCSSHPPPSASPRRAPVHAQASLRLLHPTTGPSGCSRSAGGSSAGATARPGCPHPAHFRTLQVASPGERREREESGCEVSSAVRGEELAGGPGVRAANAGAARPEPGTKVATPARLDPPQPVRPLLAIKPCTLLRGGGCCRDRSRKRLGEKGGWKAGPGLPRTSIRPCRRSTEKSGTRRGRRRRRESGGKQGFGRQSQSHGVMHELRRRAPTTGSTPDGMHRCH